jgi:mercuric ion binding protein
MKPLLIIAFVALAAMAFFATNALSTNPTDDGSGAQGRYRAVLSVEGMTCSGCIYTIKNSLAGLEGIDDVQVDVAAGKAVIVYDRQKQPDADKMAAAITASGYPAKVQRIDSPDQIRKQAIENQARSATAIAAVGNAEIPRTAFEAEMAHARSRYLMAYGADAFDNTQGRQLLNNLKSQIAQRLIDETIQLQEVHRAGFTVAPSVVTQQYEAFWKERGFANRAAFENALEKNGYAPAYFTKRFENRVLINTYIDTTVMTTHLNEIEKRQRYADWFANARLLADVTFYDKDLERLVQQQSSGGGCGNSCNAGK